MPKNSSYGALLEASTPSGERRSVQIPTMNVRRIPDIRTFEARPGDRRRFDAIYEQLGIKPEPRVAESPDGTRFKDTEDARRMLEGGVLREGDAHKLQDLMTTPTRFEADGTEVISEGPFMNESVKDKEMLEELMFQELSDEEKRGFREFKDTYPESDSFTLLETIIKMRGRKPILEGEEVNVGGNNE